MEKLKNKAKCKWLLFVLIMLSIFPGLLTAAPGNANKPASPPGRLLRGRAAIEALGEHFGEVAASYGKSVEKLTELFLRNNDLYLDSANNLLYACSIEAPPDAAPPQGPEQTTSNSIVPHEDTFLLHSLAGSSRVIYLDFDGHVTSGTIWNTNFNNGNDIVSVPYDIDGNPDAFSTTELDRIQNIWARVAEDFVIYNIDVTTEDPGVEALRKSSPSDDYYGIRVVISPSSSWYGNAGGVAYVGSFDVSTDRPCFVFSDKLGNGGEKYVAECASHETGHTLGLYHDGTIDGTEYYQGHGDWAPIMGNGYYRPITQWSKGEYDGANNQEDDLAIMLTQGARYMADDHGASGPAATPIILGSGGIDATGIVEKNTDVDVFSFAAGAGDISILIDPADLSPNLDIGAELYDSLGGLVASSDPAGLPASIAATVPAGTYYLHITGVGTGDPSTGYSDYASIGQYFISGTGVDPGNQSPPSFSSDPFVKPDATEDAPYAATIADDATDPDEEDTLVFSKISGPAWLSVAANGDVTGTPTNDDVGDNVWTVQVSDGRGGTDQAALEIFVNNTNDAPSFNSDPITKPDAAIDTLYSASVAGEASDPDAGDALVFSKVSGPAWLSVAANGDLAGTPTVDDIGLNIWLVNVSDGEAADEATLQINVPDPFVPVDDFTNGETPVAGTITGSHIDTHVADNGYQAVTEIESGGKPSKRKSFLEHVWTIDVAGGDKVTFHVQAYHSANDEGDDFVFAYSTDDINYTNMVTVTKTSDDNTDQTYDLPSTTAGTVYIRVTDADQTQGARSLDTVYIDSLFIQSQISQTPDPTCTPVSCHVESIACGTAAGSRGSNFGQVTVTIRTNCGEPAVGAEVTGTFSGDYTGTFSATTDPSGQAIFTSTTETKKPAYTFCVNDVVYEKFYAPADNIVDCASY